MSHIWVTQVTHTHECRRLQFKGSAYNWVMSKMKQPYFAYVVTAAATSRLLQSLGLFCKRGLQKRRYSAKDTYDFKEPTNCSHPMWTSHLAHMDESCHTYGWVVSQIWMCHVTYMDESCTHTLAFCRRLRFGNIQTVLARKWCVYVFDLSIYLHTDASVCVRTRVCAEEKEI